MPTVFHAITDKNVGGAGAFLCALLSHSEENRGSPVLLPEGSLLSSRLGALGTPCYFAPLGGGMRDVFPCTRLLKRHRPALAVSHASFAFRVAAKRLGIPTVSVKHCDLPIPRAHVPLYNAVTDLTVATSRAAAKHLREAGIKRVTCIENGYTPIGVPSDEERRLARRALGLPQEGLLVGLSGRLAPVKGHACAIRALARLGEDAAPSLVFLGEGEERARLAAFARACGVAGRVYFLGFREDVKSFYHAIDAHLSCSLGSETSSLALAEGMSAGCPTFASDTEGNRARLGGGGVLFPVGADEALASLLGTLTPERCAHLSHLALARAGELPTWGEVARAYDALFAFFSRIFPRKGCFFPSDMV